MPDIFGQMFFTARSGTRNGGWSEGVFIIGESTLPAALTKLQDLSIPRCNLLGANVACSYLRVSDRLVLRDSQVVDGPLARPVAPQLPRPLITQVAVDGTLTTAPGAGASTNDFIYDNGLLGEATTVSTPQDVRCDVPASGLAIRMECGSTWLSRRTFIMRGLPDYVIQTGTDRPVAGRWLNNWIAWRNLMMNGSYGMKALDQSNTNPRFAISAINTATNTPVFTIAPAPAPPGGGGPPAMPAVGDFVRISGTRLVDSFGLKWNFDGRFQVLTVVAGPPSLYTFVGLQCPATNLNVLAKGGVRVQKFAVQVFTKIQMRRWATKKVGIPFDPFRGRTKQRIGNAV